MRTKRQNSLYEAGYKLGDLMPMTAEEAASLAPAARKSMADLEKNMFRKVEERDPGARDLKSPCLICRWCGLCKKEALTCSIFRRYVSGNVGVKKNPVNKVYSRLLAKVPDKTWAESFRDDDN